MGSKPASWQTLAEDLSQKIVSSDLAVGDKIPTETELMSTYGVTRYGVRRALNSLQGKGLIRIEQGRGTFVHNHLVPYRLGERARFTNVLLEDQITPGQEVLRVEKVEADTTVSNALGIELGRPVLLMENLGYADGQVVKRDTNYFPLPRFAEMRDTLRRARSVTDALAKHGVQDYKRRSTSIVGRLPTPAEARILRQLPSNPVFEIVRLDIDLEDRPIIFGITIFSCERVRLALDLTHSNVPPLV